MFIYEQKDSLIHWELIGFTKVDAVYSTVYMISLIYGR